jgi:hypothetical protein
LVDLYWENSPVIILVTTFLDRPGKRFIEATDSIPEQVMASHKKWKMQVSLLGLGDQLHEIDFFPVLAPRTHDGMTGRVDFNISLRPSLDIVE